MGTRRSKRALSTVERVSRDDLSEATKFVLAAQAAGRCQFDGCNDLLYEHHLTRSKGNFAQVAHIVAYREGGPRGADDRPEYINDVSNLMLLCAKCHKLIDDDPETFTRAVLEAHKKAHEHRINHVTGLGPDRKTAVIVLKARIADEVVAVSNGDIYQAVAPRYPAEREPFTIDLTSLRSDGALYRVAAETLERYVTAFYAPGGPGDRASHVSVLGLAPIPVLMLLGARLSNKVATDVYQRHRDTENWTWKTDGAVASYAYGRVQEGGAPDRAAIMLSLSGKIAASQLPPHVDASYSLYELTLERQAPTPTYLRRREDLEGFKVAYQACMRTIMRDHPHLEEISVFPAIPAPVAVLVGRELLRKVDPALRVYDFDRRTNGFIEALRICR